MSKTDKNPGSAPHPPSKPAADRLARQAEALRANLSRRKAQARERAQDAPQDGNSHDGCTPDAATVKTEP